MLIRAQAALTGGSGCSYCDHTPFLGRPYHQRASYYAIAGSSDNPQRRERFC